MFLKQPLLPPAGRNRNNGLISFEGKINVQTKYFRCKHEVQLFYN